VVLLARIAEPDLPVLPSCDFGENRRSDRGREEETMTRLIERLPTLLWLAAAGFAIGALVALS